MKFDEIGHWSEIKLEIIKDYAGEYSKILSNQKNLNHVYIDAFAGEGMHFSRESGELIKGSPLVALNIQPPFNKFYFIDVDKHKIEQLKELGRGYNNVIFINGDCNVILINDVFPKIKFKSYQRGLCLLDPYGLHLNWDVIETAGKQETIEVFINFPVMDMNRNVLWTNPEKVQIANIERMNKFWGDETWKKIAYSITQDLFGDDILIKRQARNIALAFRDRLKNKATFKYVPEPIPFRNTTHGLLYYLFFASHNPVAGKIINYIFNKNRRKGWI